MQTLGETAEDNDATTLLTLRQLLKCLCFELITAEVVAICVGLEKVADRLTETSRRPARR